MLNVPASRFQTPRDIGHHLYFQLMDEPLRPVRRCAGVQDAPGRQAARENDMLRLSLASLVLATLCVPGSPGAHAKTCIRDLAGQIVCGELVETRDDPSDQADSRKDESRELAPEPPCEPGKVRVKIRGNSQCYPREAEPPSAPNFGGNVVRPVRGNNGAISCSNPNYTWQDGACRPYRGPR